MSFFVPVSHSHAPSLILSFSLSWVLCTAILMKMLFLSTQYQVRTRYIFPTGIFRELCFVKWSLAFINQAKKLKMSPTHANTFPSIIVSKIFFYAFPLFYLELIELPDTTHLFSQWIVKYFKIKVRFFPILFPCTVSDRKKNRKHRILAYTTWARQLLCKTVLRGETEKVYFIKDEKKTQFKRKNFNAKNNRNKLIHFHTQCLYSVDYF